MSFDHLKDKARHTAEDRLLNTLHIKCKECDGRMRAGRQEGIRYYQCDNAAGHKDNMIRVVWVETPPNWLDWQLDSELASEKETD
jgi:hypothetical protein